jgi:hypothetical protein
MAYEKFIKKDGKLYGPYIYHSKRVDGKVISEYHGQKKFDFSKYSKLFLIVMGVFLLGIFIYFFASPGKNITGNAVLDLNANYKQGQPLNGKIKLSLQEGELIPSSSKVVVENNGKTSEFNLKDLISEETATGNFYVDGASVSGSGEGYGIPGEKEIFPEVSFILNILSEGTNQGDNTTIGISENQTSGTEPGLFGIVSNFFLGLTPTGSVVAEFENEIQGKASSDKFFTYSLQEGQRVEIKPKSVKTDFKQLDDNQITLKTEGNEVTVTTDYTEKEKGFGSDYKGSGSKEITIDVSDLNLVLTEGNLKVSIVNQGQELISVETLIKNEGDVTATEIVKEQPVNEQLPVNVINSSIVSAELTSEEKAVLTKEFGSLSVQVGDAKLKNGFIVVRYVFGNRWIENSYSSELSNATLYSSMELDKVKWLKDIAKSLSPEKVPEENIGWLEGSIVN